MIKPFLRHPSVLLFVLLLFVFADLSYALGGRTVPTGVYASWGRIGANAETRNIPLDSYLREMLHVLKRHSVNCIWITNLPAAQLSYTARAADEIGIDLYANVAEVEGKLSSRDSTYYGQMVPPIIESVRSTRNPVTWVLADEPTQDRHDEIQDMVRLFYRLDPRRDTTLVANRNQFGSFVDLASLYSICLNIYPFFGPRDPNGPHTVAASQQYFRTEIDQARSRTARSARFFVMGQAYAEIWGPQEYDRDLNLVGLSGAYVHWIQPSPSAIRWQFWEAIGRGAEGFFLFTATALPLADESFTATSAQVTWTYALVKKPTNAGPSAILNHDLSVTPQLLAYQEEIERVRGIWELLQSLRRASIPARLSRGFDAFGFQAADGSPYALVINNNLFENRSVELNLDSSFRSIRDVTGRSGSLSSKGTCAISRRARWTCLLPAGSGTLLKFEKE